MFYIFITLLLLLDTLNLFCRIPNRSMTSEDRLIKVGPTRCGHENLQFFDLRGCNEISQIFVSGGEDGIESIQFQYVENGKYVVSNRYGNGSITTNFHTIELDHPAEYITGINGLYSNKIHMITFTTNIQEYGPFGVKNPNLQILQSFTYNLGKSSQFGGFHGIYSTNTLISLGVYLRAKAVPPSSGSKTSRIELGEGRLGEGRLGGGRLGGGRLRGGLLG